MSDAKKTNLMELFSEGEKSEMLKVFADMEQKIRGLSGEKYNRFSIIKEFCVPMLSIADSLDIHIKETKAAAEQKNFERKIEEDIGKKSNFNISENPFFREANIVKEIVKLDEKNIKYRAYQSIIFQNIIEKLLEIIEETKEHEIEMKEMQSKAENTEKMAGFFERMADKNLIAMSNVNQNLMKALLKQSGKDVELDPLIIPPETQEQKTRADLKSKTP